MATAIRAEKLTKVYVKRRSLREMAWYKVQRGLIPISEQERWTRVIDPAALIEKR